MIDADIWRGFVLIHSCLQLKFKTVLKDLEKKISPILVINNSSLKPYVELFDYAPENIYQQPLGSLVGFFEVKEYSDDSAYIVNFLTSVLKKEYYINPKRSVTESLDSALHKVNMALSELAKHGNIEWLGKLNAAICVLEKNSAHFSVAGNAKIFLHRGKGFNEISEDLASDSPDPHPLKTFVNVSSGRLEKNDRLLITSEDIFHIFSFQELKKNCERFEGEKFVQFLKTALSNQMEMIASMVVETYEEETKPAKTSVKKKVASAEINAFSGKTFEEKTNQAPKEESSDPQDNLVEENENSEYIDQKTGHIYVQGEVLPVNENSKLALFLENSGEKTAEIWYLAKNEFRRKSSVLKKQIARKLEQRRQEKAALAEQKAEELKRLQEEEVLKEIEREQQLAEQKEAERILLEKQKEEEKLQSQLAELDKEEDKEQKPIPELSPSSIEIPAKSCENETVTENLSFKDKLNIAIKQQKRSAGNVIDLRAPLKQELSFEEELEDTNLIDSEIAKEDAELIPENVPSRTIADQIKPIIEKISNSIKNVYFSSIQKIKDKKNIQGSNSYSLAPHFSKIRKSFSLFSAKQKTYAVLALVIVFIVPLFIVHFLNEPKKPTINDLSKTPVAAQPTINEKNLISSEKQTVISRNDIQEVLVTTSGPIAFSKSSVLMNNKEYSLPQGSGLISQATFMNDLSLVLILTDQNKIISFSPISLKFAENNIGLSNNIQKSFLGTYMTYLYVLDPSANQIYRYPRADGGFGEKTNWLKENSSLEGVTDMTIDDSIFTIQNNQLSKYFKGQKQTFSLENANTPVHFDKIFTNIDSSSLWALDKTNARIVQFSKADGSITKQYSSEELKNAICLAVDEKNKTAYAVTSSGLISIAL